MTGIVDYGMGNLWSVFKKLKKVDGNAIISSNPVELEKCNNLILPGVGHFSAAVKEIKARELWDPLNRWVLEEKKPILGICLGMQLMAGRSEEGGESGFGWIDAEIVRFRIKDKVKYKVPHIGWNKIYNKKAINIFKEVNFEDLFYFVHSYHVVCNDQADIAAETQYEYCFTSVIQRGNVTGVQFHPEKSHDAGELLIKNFVHSV